MSRKLCFKTLFAVSRNDSGSCDVENRPKKESMSAASVLFLDPVFPVSIKTVCGSLSACRKKEFSGDRKVKASNGNMTRSGATR